MIEQQYILLKLEEKYLFIPQNEVESVEIIADVQITNTTFGAIGWFFGHGLESPIFCLDKNLFLLEELPNARQYFVLLKSESEQSPLGITCDEVENISFAKEHLYPQELPLVMKTPHSPVRQLLVYQEQMACICSGPALVKHLDFLQQAFQKEPELEAESEPSQT